MKCEDLNLRHLRAFVKTCDLGTLLAAANAVHLSQPALTQGLHKLESQLNVTLFQRASGGMQPTAAANLLLPRAKRALEYIRSSRATHKQIRAFVALASHGTYASASNATGNANASLHRAVRDLEAALGIALTERVGRGIKLTRQGKATARRFRLAYAELTAAIDEVAHLNDEGHGRIAIGAMPLCRARLLPQTIIQFHNTSPNCHIKVLEGAYTELIEPLRDGELDMLIGALRNPTDDPDLQQRPLFQDQPVIVGRHDHPLASRKRISPSDLASYEWCLPPTGVLLRDRWQSIFTEAGMTVPEVSLECGSAMMLRQILKDTDCLTILSPDQVAVELEAGWLTVLADTPQSLNRTIGVISRREWRPTPMQQSFLHSLEQCGS